MKFIKDLSIDEACFTQWKAIRENKIKGFVLTLSDSLEGLVVHSVIENGQSWNEFVKTLPDGDCRYFVYDMELTKTYEFNDVEMKIRKYAFVTWVPIKSSVKKRMMTASYKGTIKENLFEQKFDLDWCLDDRCDLELDDRFCEMKKTGKYSNITKIR